MRFFESYFKDVDFDNVNASNEVQVLCPFPHNYDSEGNAVYETRPSANINVDKEVFYCHSCGRGLSEEQFISEVENLSSKEAKNLLKAFENDLSNVCLGANERLKSAENRHLFTELGLTEKTVNELQLGEIDGGLAFPVYLYNTLLDVRVYKKGQKPKCKSCAGAKEGLIIPFDIWKKETKRITILCAGEKDMAITREKGFNAITITGGELKVPTFFNTSFEGKAVYICYDNDDAGRKGAKKIAQYLFKCGAKPHIVTGHHEVCVEKGGDIWDYFMRYEKTVTDFKKILIAAPEYTQDDYDEDMKQEFPQVSLMEATVHQGNRKKVFSSTVQVSSSFERVQSILDCIEFEKIIDPTDGDAFEEKGQKKTFNLDELPLDKIFYLLENEKEAITFCKRFLGIMPKEEGVVYKIVNERPIFKYMVTDYYESEIISERTKRVEHLCYVLDKPLDNGGKYKINYRLVSNPINKQELVMVATTVSEANDSVTKFRVTEAVKEKLKCFQSDDVKAKMHENFLRARDIIGKFANEQIYYSTDLFYHTPLQITYGRPDNKIRGCLDVMIIGETRTGKSKTADSLLKLYELGTFLSLKTSTSVGLIGGSKSVNGSWKVTIGAIPRNHTGAVIMEEFQGCPPDFINRLTDIRSSNKVRIARSDGELTVPCAVRMLTLSNQKSEFGGTKSLRSYSNGIEVIKELVEANEDIARYDFFTLVGEPDQYTSPFETVEVLPQYDKENYKARVRWVWSRKPDDIVIAQEVGMYIWEKAQELNKEYNTHIKIFGSEADQKLARVSTAVAGMLVSTDPNFEHIIVKKEHVDWAFNFLNSLYNNNLFRLKEYAEEERKFTILTEEDLGVLQEAYQAHFMILKQLENTSITTRTQLYTICGETKEQFDAVMSVLTHHNFIRWRMDKIIPSEKLRIGLARIDKTIEVDLKEV